MSNYTVSSDVDTLLKKSSKADIKEYLNVPNVSNLTTTVQSNSANWNSTFTMMQANSANWTKNMVTISQAGVGNTAVLSAISDETFYLNSSATAPLSTFFIQLPNYLNSYVGQTKTIISSKDVTVFTVSVQSGGTSSIVGNILTTLLAYDTKAYQCIQKSGTSVTWLRLA